LPLYRARAGETKGDADRLYYARALLRAGEPEQAKGILDSVANEGTEAEDEEERVARKAGVVASSLLAGGFPSLAVGYARKAANEGEDPRRALLLLRALTASRDVHSARRQATELLARSSNWEPGPRYELARSLIALDDSRAAETLLRVKSSEAVGEVFRSSILANLSFNRGDWEKAEQVLTTAERAAPPDLGGRVSGQWRNVKRELLSVRLRRGVTLLQLGKQSEAIAELDQAKKSDEESVRSAALLLLVSSRLSGGRRAEAFASLDALSGHDPRFEPSVAALKAAVTTGSSTPDDLVPLERILAGQDAYAAFVAKAVCDILGHSMTAPAPAPTHASSRL